MKTEVLNPCLLTGTLKGDRDLLRRIRRPLAVKDVRTIQADNLGTFQINKNLVSSIC
jgi:hypothetical protein